MAHGRNHEDREHHIRLRRTTNTPESDVHEVEVFTSGRKRWAPREGLVGAHKARRAPTDELLASRDRQEEPVGAGAEVAPTERARERERARHEGERAVGRTAAGTQGKLRDERRPEVTRSALEEAAAAADRAVGATNANRSSRDED